jgi:prepilin-type N-terminal cleavage/methylation domain-containing protein
MRHRGFTFVEILIVMILIGLIAAMGIPRIRDALQKQNVRSTRVAIGTLVVKARAAAVQRGCRSAIHFTSGANGSVWITVCKTNVGGLDTLGGIERLAARFNVNLTSGRDSVVFFPNGISQDNVFTTIRIQSSTGSDSVMINPVGKVVR